MKKIIHADIDVGIDSLMKILGVIRRKDYQVTSINLSNCCEVGKSLVEITMIERVEKEAVTASIQLEKIFGVSNVRITN